MVFGQVLIGPPGSGKTTYRNGMSLFLQLSCRKVAIINLDPANDVFIHFEQILNSVLQQHEIRYACTINIEELIKLSDVMTEHSPGPNGGLVYCMDYLDKNIDWLQFNPLSKGWKLTKELCNVIEDYSIVDFTTMDIQDEESVGNLVKLIDKSSGYIFAGVEPSAVEFSKITIGPVDWNYYRYPLLFHSWGLLDTFTAFLIVVTSTAETRSKDWTFWVHDHTNDVGCFANFIV